MDHVRNNEQRPAKQPKDERKFAQKQQAVLEQESPAVARRTASAQKASTGYQHPAVPEEES
jgi:hypothetical protein